MGSWARWGLEQLPQRWRKLNTRSLPESGWRSSPPSGATTRTPGTWPSGSSPATRSKGKWHQPPLEVVSAYVDQFPENDLSRQRAKEFGFTIYPTIAEALRCGGDKLAVDAVLIIGEHGNYPNNEYGQKKYPRYEFFKQVADVFRKDGRTVPVFNDKHLSWNWEWAKEMVDTVARAELPVPGRLVAAGDLADAVDRHAVRGRGRGGACAWRSAASTATTSTRWR